MEKLDTARSTDEQRSVRLEDRADIRDALQRITDATSSLTETFEEMGPLLEQLIERQRATT